MEFSQGTEERVRNSRGRRAISVRATEVLLYLWKKVEKPIFEQSATVRQRIIDPGIHNGEHGSNMSVIHIQIYRMANMVESCL